MTQAPTNVAVNQSLQTALVAMKALNDIPRIDGFEDEAYRLLQAKANEMKALIGACPLLKKDGTPGEAVSNMSQDDFQQKVAKKEMTYNEEGFEGPTVLWRVPHKEAADHRWYAVLKGLRLGVVQGSLNVKKLTCGVRGAEYQAFKTEDAATEWLNENISKAQELVKARECRPDCDCRRIQ